LQAKLEDARVKPPIGIHYNVSKYFPQILDKGGRKNKRIVPNTLTK
jgi:hypothetical protein